MKIGAVGFGNRIAHVYFELKKINQLKTITPKNQNEFKELEIHVSQSPTDKMMIDMAKNFI